MCPARCPRITQPVSGGFFSSLCALFLPEYCMLSYCRRRSLFVQKPMCSRDTQDTLGFHHVDKEGALFVRLLLACVPLAQAFEHRSGSSKHTQICTTSCTSKVTMTHIHHTQVCTLTLGKRPAIQEQTHPKLYSFAGDDRTFDLPRPGCAKVDRFGARSIGVKR